MGVTSSMRPIFMPERARALRADCAPGLGLLSNSLSSQHSGVGGGLVTIGLHLHATGHTDDGFPARQVCDMDESVVERGVDVGHPKDVLTIAHLGSQGHLDLLLVLPLSLSWSHPVGVLKIWQNFLLEKQNRKSPM